MCFNFQEYPTIAITLDAWKHQGKIITRYEISVRGGAFKGLPGTKKLPSLDRQIFIYNNNTQATQTGPIHMIKAWKTPKRYIESSDI